MALYIECREQFLFPPLLNVAKLLDVVKPKKV